jgi:hypothetical protein
MADLRSIYEELIASSTGRGFETALMSTPLADERIYTHPLGFRVIRTADGSHTLRLHIWHQALAGQQPGFEVHDHSFDLESCVLDGQLESELYAAEPSEAGKHAIYRVIYAAGRSILERTQTRVRLRVTSAETVGPGQRYYIAAGQLHSTRCRVFETAMSLVLTVETGHVPITIGPWAGVQRLEAGRTPVDDRSLREIGLSQARLA